MDTQQSRTDLEEKRNELLERLEKINKDKGTRLSTDSSERAVELENTEVLNEIARVTEEELEKVETLIKLKLS